MDLTLIIILIIYIAIATTAYLILKSIAKTLMIMSGIGFVIVLTLGILLYQDVNDIKQNWPTTQKLMLLEDNGKIIAGIQTTMAKEEEPTILEQAKLDNIQTNYISDNLASIKEENYKIIILKLDPILQEIQGQNIEAGEFNFTKIEASNILRSQNAQDELATIISKKENEKKEDTLNRIQKDIGSNAKIKAMIFGILFQQLMQEKGPQVGTYIIKEYKNENILIYPKTAIFRFIGYVPQSLINTISEKIQSKNQGEI